MKEDKKKLKEIKREERYKTKLLKLRKKYGISDINEWVAKYPNTATRLVYDVFIEGEEGVAKRQAWAFVLLGLATVVLFAALFIPSLIFPAIIFMFFSFDTHTNARIDRLEQRQWREMVYNMYRSEKEVKNETTKS